MALGARFARSGRFVLAFVATTLVAPVVGAQAPAADTTEDAARSNARQLASEASEAYRLAQYDVAYDRFNRAFRLVGVPALGVWSARSLERAGRLVEASERYREVLHTKVAADAPASYAEALGNARAELDELVPRIPNLVIRLENAAADDVQVTLNGKAVPGELLEVKQRVNPGSLQIRATRGDEVVERSETIGERETKEVVLEFSELQAAVSPSGPSSGASTEDTASGTDLRPAAWVTMGAGGVFLLGGIITGAVALGQESALSEDCDAETRACPNELGGRVSEFDTMRTLSTIGFVGGAVLLGAGATLYFVGGPTEKAEPSVALYWTGGSGGFRGRF